MFQLLVHFNKLNNLLTDVVACATEEACLEACGSASGCTNYAYSLLVLQLMPSGARGTQLKYN